MIELLGLLFITLASSSAAAGPCRYMCSVGSAEQIGGHEVCPALACTVLLPTSTLRRDLVIQDESAQVFWRLGGLDLRASDGLALTMVVEA